MPQLRYIGRFPRYRGHRMDIPRGTVITVDWDLAHSLLKEAERIDPGSWEDVTMGEGMFQESVLEDWTPGGTSIIGRLAVVMLTYNGWHYTKRALPTIQTGAECKVVVVDNHSTDETLARLAQLPVSVQRPHGGRCGVAAALNIGLKKALQWKPDGIAVLNNDVILPEGYLDGLMQLLRKHPKAGMVTGVQKTPSGVEPRARHLVLRGGTEPIPDLVISGDMSAFVLDVAAVQEVGFFDEVFLPRYIEDNDYVHRLILAGYSPLRSGEHVYEHFHMTTYRENPELRGTRRDELRANLKLYVRKWGDAPRGSDAFRGDVGGYDDSWKFTGGAWRDPWREGGQSQMKRRHAIVIQPGRLGDIIATLPIARELARRCFRVHWAVAEPYASVFEHTPYVKEVHSYPASGSPFEALEQMRSDARDACFEVTADVCISGGRFQEFLKSGLSYADFQLRLAGMDGLAKRPEFVYEGEPLPVHAGTDESRQKRILFAPFGYSAPIQYELDAWDDLLVRLIEAGYEVVLSCSDDQSWAGTTPMPKFGSVDPLSLLPQLVQHHDLVLAPSTAMAWIAYAGNVPLVQLLPTKHCRAKNAAGEHHMQLKYSVDANWDDPSWDAADFYPDEQDPRALFDVIRNHLEAGIAIREGIQRLGFTYPWTDAGEGKVPVFYTGPTGVHPAAGIVRTGVNHMHPDVAEELLQKGIVQRV